MISKSKDLLDLKGTILLDTNQINGVDSFGEPSTFKFDVGQLNEMYNLMQNRLPMDITLSHLDLIHEFPELDILRKEFGQIGVIKKIKFIDNKIVIQEGGVDKKYQKYVESGLLNGISYNASMFNENLLDIYSYSLVKVPACDKCTINVDDENKIYAHKLKIVGGQLMAAENKNEEKVEIDKKQIWTDVEAEIYIDKLVDENKISESDKSKYLNVAKSDIDLFKDMTQNMPVIGEHDVDEGKIVEEIEEEKSQMVSSDKDFETAEDYIRAKIQAEDIVDQLIVEGKVLPSERPQHVKFAINDAKVYAQLVDNRENLKLKEKIYAQVEDKQKMEEALKGKGESKFSFAGLVGHYNNQKVAKK